MSAQDTQQQQPATLQLSLEGGSDEGSVGDMCRFGIVTVSDRASAGIYEDESGPAILRFFHEAIKSRWATVSWGSAQWRQGDIYGVAMVVKQACWSSSAGLALQAKAEGRVGPSTCHSKLAMPPLPPSRLPAAAGRQFTE